MFKSDSFKPIGMFLLGLLIFGLFVSFPKQTYAVTFTVNDAGDTVDASPGDGICADGIGNCTLRAAIGEANALAGADTIVFDSSLDFTAITFSIAGRNEDSNATGDLDITDDLTITGNSARRTIIDGNQLDRIFHILGTITVELNALTITNGQTLGSTPGRGGGIRNDNGGDLTINDSTISNNTSGNQGGGIYTDAIGGTGTVTTIQRSTITGNTANEGGGINTRNEGATNIRNSTVSGNTTATSQGGGVAVGDANSTTNIDNSTITGNISTSAGGGIHTEAGGTLLFKNSIVIGNTSINTTAEDCSGTTSAGFNVTGGAATGCPTIGSDFTSGTPANEVNAALLNNGGNTDTHSLPAGSQAIDAGDPNNCDRIDGTDVTIDQRGVARPQGAQCDIGAFEVVTTIGPTGTGPGGVGTNDGSSNLQLWLRGDRGIYSDSSCSTAATDNGNTGCWEDQSGNGYNATQATGADQPSYHIGVVNGMPTIRFDRASSESLQKSYESDLNSSSFTTFIVTRATGDTGTFRSPLTSRSTLPASGFNFYASSGNDWEFWTRDTIWNNVNGPAVVLNNWEILEGRYDNSSTTQSIILNGAVTSQAVSGFIPNGTCALKVGAGTGGAGGCDDNHFYTGDISEVIFYSDAQTNVQRILVENYLSSKYNRSLSANDIYLGDTNLNGDFDLDVAGIAQIGGNQNAIAHSAGIIVQDSNFLLADGDSILFGHRTLQNANTQDNLPAGWDTTTQNPQRWVRDWFFDVRGETAGETVDIIFDFSEGSMNACCPPSGSPSNYWLLKRDPANSLNDYTAEVSATAIVGDQVFFQDVDVAILGSSFTLGTLNYADSPTAVTMQNFSVATESMPIVLIGSLLVLALVSLGIFVRRRELKA